jgi:formylglycine-generating enzyme required for sulfatase activity
MKYGVCGGSWLSDDDNWFTRVRLRLPDVAYQALSFRVFRRVREVRS